MPRVATHCANLFHAEVEGADDDVVVTTNYTVESLDELAELLARGVDIHGRCYCGHVTPVTLERAILLDESA